MTILQGPESLACEHDEIRAELLAAVKAGGDIGRAAEAVATLLTPHLDKEDAFALPPLAALPRLVRGEPVPEGSEIVTMYRQLQRELPVLLQEHRTAITALENFVAAARKEGAHDWVRFAVRLMRHFRLEEELVYPTAILVGAYLDERLSAALD